MGGVGEIGLGAPEAVAGLDVGPMVTGAWVALVILGLDPIFAAVSARRTVMTEKRSGRPSSCSSFCCCCYGEGAGAAQAMCIVVCARVDRITT